MCLHRCLVLLVLLFLSLPACQRPSPPDHALPFADRQILAERIVWARDAQLQAAAEFAAALDSYRAVMAQGGDPEVKYRTLWHTNERSRTWAEHVRSHIDGVEEVGRGLFNQWELELGHYQNERLRTASGRYLGEVRGQYLQMLDAMRKAEEQLQPLQAGFNDQTLSLKHGLDQEGKVLQGLQTDIANFIGAMEISVRETDAFLVRLQKSVEE
jgi:hypothetical protein